MKRRLTLFFVALLLFVLSGCGSQAAISHEDSAAGQVIVNAEKPLKKILLSIEKANIPQRRSYIRAKLLEIFKQNRAANETIQAIRKR